MYNILYVTKVKEKPYPRILLRTTCKESVNKIIEWLNKNSGRHFSGRVDQDAGAYAVCLTVENVPFHIEESESFLKSINSFEKK